MDFEPYPPLPGADIAATRDALHDYARVLETVIAANRPRRKHWWHASLRPTLDGLTTGIVHAAAPFEIVLDFGRSELRLNVAGASGYVESLAGQPAVEVANNLRSAFEDRGLGDATLPASDDIRDASYPDYDPQIARRLCYALHCVVAAMERLQASIREETSPIQLWPHHFDLAMLWLPGDRVEGQDAADEEHADKQMNFGFVFGDAQIAEPYFYVTAYPTPDAMRDIELPAGSRWRRDGFDGVLLEYATLGTESDPGGYLDQLWQALLAAGRLHLMAEAV